MRKIGLLLLAAVIGCSCFGQHFMHGIGTTTSLIFGKVNTGSIGYYNFSLRQANFTYFPRYNFIEKDNSSLSVGAPVGIGVGLLKNEYNNEFSAYFSYEIPIVLDYNIGLKSTEDNDSQFGFYIGAGFSYYNISLRKFSPADFDGKTYGPLARMGARFDISRNSVDKKAVTFGLFFKKGMEAAKFSTVGINLLLDF